MHASEEERVSMVIPSCTPHRRMTWAGVLPTRVAIAAMCTSSTALSLLGQSLSGQYAVSTTPSSELTCHTGKARPRPATLSA